MYWISIAVLGAAHYFYRRGLGAEMAAMMQEADGPALDEQETAAETGSDTQARPSSPKNDGPKTDPLDVPGNLEGVEDPLERHKIYTRGIELAYGKKNEADPAMRQKAKSFALDYVREFPLMKDAVFTYLAGSRYISVFKELAILYEEEQELDKALSLCNQARLLGLEDGTKTGYQGRIDRLKKKFK